jgi:hypothetical protein
LTKANANGFIRVLGHLYLLYLHCAPFYLSFINVKLKFVAKGPLSILGSRPLVFNGAPRGYGRVMIGDSGTAQ